MIFFDEEIIYQYIGYAAGLATIFTFLFQILKIIETKNVSSLSSYMYTIYSLGLVCWATYGIYIESWILVFANLITFVLTFTILLLIIYYDAEDKIERARRDNITTAFNRKYFLETVPVKIAESITHKTPFAVMIATAVNQPEIAKQCGEKNGIKALQELAKFLEKDLRDSDMVARFEKNKFIIFVSNADEKSAKIVAERLFKNSQNIRVKATKNMDLDIDVNIGVCTSKYANTLDELIKKAMESAESITSKSRSKIKLYAKK